MFRRHHIPVLALAMVAPIAAHAQFSDSFNFIKAVRDADGAKATELLNRPGTVIVNTRDGQTGETALHIVTARRDSLWLTFMLARGGDPNLRDLKGNTALMVATQLGWADGIQTLIKRRATVDLANSSGETPLIRAVQNRDIASVRLLLAAGASTTRPDNAAGLSAKDYATRDPRAGAILKEIIDARPITRREVAGPR